METQTENLIKSIKAGDCICGENNWTDSKRCKACGQYQIFLETEDETDYFDEIEELEEEEDRVAYQNAELDNDY